jgi:hypothetical protein
LLQTRKITVSHCDICRAGTPDVLSVDPRNTAKAATGPTGLSEVSYWEWFKIGLLGLLISTVSTVAIGSVLWWVMK